MDPDLFLSSKRDRFGFRRVVLWAIPAKVIDVAKLARYRSNRGWGCCTVLYLREPIARLADTVVGRGIRWRRSHFRMVANPVPSHFADE